MFTNARFDTHNMRSDAASLMFVLGMGLLSGCSSSEFDHQQALSARGKDGATYTLNLFWNDSPSSHGNHAIRVVTVSPGKPSIVQEFTSGNRMMLTTVSVQHAPGQDLVLFHCASGFADQSLSTHTNTVDATGLHGYPEMIAQSKLRAAEAGAALLRAREETRRQGNPVPNKTVEPTRAPSGASGSP